MDPAIEYWTARALLEWQIELGADEALDEAPVNRYALEAEAPKVLPHVAPKVAQPTAPAAPPAIVEPIKVDAAAAATRMARAAADLPALAQAMQAFDLCEIKKGARNFVFADGQPAARVMIVGEAPDRDEDQQGRPFVGKVGQMLDRMLAAIGLDRRATDPSSAVYLTTVLPWRPPADNAPDPADVAMMLPFLERHIALANPDLVVLMGNAPCLALLGKAGITRVRGEWAEVLARPALPMFHPATLLRTPEAKREAWADLLTLKARLG